MRVGALLPLSFRGRVRDGRRVPQSRGPGLDLPFLFQMEASPPRPDEERGADARASAAG